MTGPQHRPTIGLGFRVAKRAYSLSRRFGTFLGEHSAGVETSEMVTKEQLGLVADDYAAYEPSPWSTMRRLLPRHEVQGGAFVDLGCGKGRVLLQAARYPFDRVVGVEISEELSEIARHNARSFRGRLRCGDVEVLTCDAAAYEFPDDTSVVFLYNPFRGDMMARAIENLRRSLERNPRTIRVLYRNPVEHDLLVRRGLVPLATVRDREVGVKPIDGLTSRAFGGTLGCATSVYTFK